MTEFVGIFWLIDQDRALVLLSDKTPVAEAEPYGLCLGHPTGHTEFWERLGLLGESSLRAHGLPTAPVWHGYDEFPRGRVVYMPGAGTFVIYADRRLHALSTMRQIAQEFGLTGSRFVVRGDPHYARSRHG